MHGHELLENPAFSIILILAGLFLLYRSLTIKRKYRMHQHSPHNDLEIKILGHSVLDSNRGWIMFTFFIGLVAIGSHFLAEYVFHIYDVTPIDRITHGLSGMAVTALILNFYLTRKRRLYYGISIGVSWFAFVLWEVYEWIFFMMEGSSGFIQTDPWDMVIDLWVDTLGALSICFIYDEYTGG